jgi:ankyrin repeat protein
MGLNLDLVKATKSGELDLVKRLIAEGADISTTAGDSLKKRSLIHHAAQKGHLDLVSFFLNNDLYFNILDKDGRSSLYYACEEYKIEVAKILIEKGANININSDWNPLCRACECSFEGTEIVQLLLDAGADVNLECGGTRQIALANALHQIKIRATELLIEAGAKINHIDSNGETPLMNIASHNSLAHIQLLFEHGATVKGKNIYNGNEVMHNAAFGGNTDVIKLLLDKGATIESKNNDGETPIQIAVHMSKLKAVKLLVESGADVNVKNKEGLNIIEVARQTKKREHVLKYLESLPQEVWNTKKSGFWSKLMGK